MKVALFGRTGQVGTEVRRRAPSDIKVIEIGRDMADFSDPKMVADVANTLKVDAIINAIAYTAVDKAEDDVDVAEAVNALSVGALAKVAAARNIPLVHISTDYVFDGSGDAPRRPDDQTGPLGVYGASKLRGEEAIRDCGGPHAILRTSWVFSAHGANFVKSMLRLAESRDHLDIVCDQVGGPTSAANIADTTLFLAHQLLAGHKAGTYHFAGTPDVSWLEFAEQIFEQAGVTMELTGIATANYPTRAQRPLNSRLDCESLARDFGIDRPDWRLELAAVIKELGKT